MRRLWTFTVIASLAWAGTAHATVGAASSAGVLTVTGGSGADVVSLVGSSSTIFVVDAGGVTPGAGCTPLNPNGASCTGVTSVAFTGNAGADRLNAAAVTVPVTADGGTENDELHVGTADGNTLRGGAGNDRLYPGPGTGDHVFGGNDPLDSGTSDIVDYADVPTTGGFGYDLNLATGLASRSTEFDDLHGIEGASGSPDDDRITLAPGSAVGIDAGGGGGDRIVANPSGGAATVDLQQQLVTQGPLTVAVNGFEDGEGTPEDDLLIGSAGVNRLYGLAGQDTYRPGAGNDLILDDSSTGANTLDHSGRSAALTFTSGNWEIAGGESDLSNAGAISRVIGGSGNDTLDGGTTTTVGWRFDGGPGNDTLTDDNGTGVLVGGAGNDTLDGRGGNDDLDGGDGDDRITGGAGQDTIRSGTGADTLLARDGEVDSLVCASATGKTVTADAGDLVGACVASAATTGPPTSTTGVTTPSTPTSPPPPGDPIAFRPPTVTRTGTPRAVRTHKKVTAVRTGLTAACAATNPRACTVVVRLTLRGRRATTVLGSATVTIAPGRRVALSVPVSSTGRSRLKRAGRLATAITAGPSSTGVPSATAKLTLLA